ncbi:MAG: alpha/beta fold hydrolase, partial [Balneolaceae bacterium]|nr:alpha/beta fold hydrolase [Balneolaceae bacterium]
LAEHYTVIIPDLPGHGRSEGRSGPFRFDLVAEDLLALMSEMGFSRFHAIGYSAGGITLFHMATIDPDRIDAMVIVSAPHQLVKEDILAYPVYENHPPQVHSYWQDVHPGGEAQVSKLIEGFHAVAEMTAEMSLSPEQLAAIEARTLYVGGDRDPLVPLPIVIEMYESVPDISLWILPEQGHSPIWPDWGGSENAARMFPEMVIRHLGDETLN